MRKAQPRLHEAGFSMIEMLMAAFILSIGILGLTMLQTLSLRTAAGSRNLGSAVLLAEQVMDQTELEGRLTYLNSNSTNYTAPAALGALQYINQAAVDQYFNLDSTTGSLVTAANPASATFRMAMRQTVAAGTGTSDVTVTVTFPDIVNPATGAVITRNVQLSRRILHG